MVTLTGIVGYVHEFDCITSDIDTNKHIPADGKLCENGDTYKYDKEHKVWIMQ